MASGVLIKRGLSVVFTFNNFSFYEERDTRRENRVGSQLGDKCAALVDDFVKRRTFPKPTKDR